MPFRSEKQRRYLWKNHPKIAKDWTDTYGSEPQPKKRSEPQPKKRGGGVKVKKTDPRTRKDIYLEAIRLKNKDRLSVQDIKRAEEATKSFKQKKNALKGTKEALQIIKKNPELIGKKKGGITSAPFLRGRSGSGNIKAWRGKEGWKEAQRLKKKLTVSDKLKMQDRGVINKKTGRLHPEHERALKSLSKKELNQLIKKGRNPRLGPESKSTFGTTARGRRKARKSTTQEGKYFRDRGFKKGGTVHPRNTGVAVPQKGLGSLIPRLAEQAYGTPKKEKKYHFKKGGIMEPYRGSYISGTVDGKMLSNPSLRKYYKGLI